MPVTRHWRRYVFHCVAFMGLLCCTWLYSHQTSAPDNPFYRMVMMKIIPLILPKKANTYQGDVIGLPSQNFKTVGEEFGAEFKNKHQIESLYRNVCHAHDPHIQVTQPKIKFKSLTLVITLNNPLYEVIPLVELLYRPLFPEIVYCIRNGSKSREPNDWNLNILYYESPSGVRAGIYNYICVEYVHKLGLKADGFLFMSDDILVSPSAVANFSRQPLPATTVCPLKSHTCTDNMTNPPAYCTFTPRYLHHATRALAAIRSENKLKPKDSVGPRCDQFLQNLTGVKDPLVHCLPDIFFIPSASMENASQLFRQFYDHKVFHGTAVYHVMLCISAPSFPNAWNYINMPKNRDDFTKTGPHVVTRGRMVVHPLKLSPLLKRTTKYVKYFCKKLLPFIHNSK